MAGRFPAHGQVAVDVSIFNGGVIDEDANCEREPARVMMLMVWPRALRHRMLTRMDKESIRQ